MNETSRRRPFRALCLGAAAAIIFAASGALGLFVASPATADVAMSITSPSNGSYWGSSGGTVSGTATAGDLVTVVSDQSGVDCTATADSSNNWSCDLEGVATDQNFIITASDTDPVNNVDDIEISVVDPPNVTSISGATQVGQTFYGGEGMPTIAGTSEPNAVITLEIGSSSCETTVADASGHWGCQVGGNVDPNLTYGREAIGLLVSQQPPWATQSSDYLADTYQYAPPLADPVFSQPANTSGGEVLAATSNTTPLFVGTAAPGASVSIYYTGSAAFDPACDTTANSAGVFTCTFAGSVPLVAGQTYLFRAEQINGINDPNNLADPLFNLHILPPPTAPVISGPAEPFSTTLTSVSISGTTDAGTVVHTLIDGKNSCVTDQSSGSWSCTATKLSVGTHSLQAYAVDVYGTKGPLSTVHHFTIKQPSQDGPLVLTGSPPTPTPTPTPVPTDPPTPAPSPAPSTPIHHADGPTHPHRSGGKPAPLSLNAPITFSSHLGTIGNAVHVSPVAAAVTGGVAAGFLGLVAFPSELLENTIRANYETAFRWLAPTRRWFASARKRASRVRVNPWLGGTAMILLSAFILGFSDRDYGFNGSSVRLFTGLVISLVVVSLVVPGIMALIAKRRFDIGVALRPLPAALLLVIASAVISRIADIQPGFLFAGIIGVSYTGTLTKQREGVLTLISTGLTVLLGLAAWIGYSAIDEQVHEHPGFWNLLAAETFTATTIEALATLVIALLPFKFLDGATLFAWKPWVWVVSYLVSLVILIFVIAPISDNWGPETAPLVGWTAFFIAFAIVAVGVWAAFRFRKSRPAEGE